MACGMEDLFRWAACTCIPSISLSSRFLFLSLSLSFQVSMSMNPLDNAKDMANKLRMTRPVAMICATNQMAQVAESVKLLAEENPLRLVIAVDAADAAGNVTSSSFSAMFPKSVRVAGGDTLYAPNAKPVSFKCDPKKDIAVRAS